MRTAIAARVDRSFDEFAGVESTRLLRSAYLLCGDRQEAEDLLQTALVRLARHWEAARHAPDAYAYRVLINLARDRARHTRRRPITVPLAAHDEAAAVPDPADAVAAHDMIAWSLARLPARQREAVTLRFLADLSIDQTAAAMGTTAGTVKTHTSRALGHLRELLTDYPSPSEAPRAH